MNWFWFLGIWKQIWGTKKNEKTYTIFVCIFGAETTAIALHFFCYNQTYFFSPSDIEAGNDYVFIDIRLFNSISVRNRKYRPRIGKNTFLSNVKFAKKCDNLVADTNEEKSQIIPIYF